MKKSCDVLIIGAGIIGLSVAHELTQRGIKHITVLEKERMLGAHASGRNSGVLHAGIYYSSDSLKAKFCSRGAALLKEYAKSKQLEVIPTGKVIVAPSEDQLPELENLFQRATENKIRVQRIDESGLRQVEPMAKTARWALYSPDTAVMDPKSILEALRSDLVSKGVDICLLDPALEISNQDKIVRTSDGLWNYGHLINAAGLEADQMAHQMGVALRYRILPFRGRYRKLRKETSDQIHGLIYPVPDPRLPFLGVHLTKTVNGDAWVGPTAEPAFGRENYTGLDGITWPELPGLLTDLLGMVIGNASGLASHIREEIKKQLPGGLLKAAQKLVPTLQSSDFTDVTKTGLRAQLMDQVDKRLVMDFVIEKGPDSTHILNAVSPGFTASFAFAEYVANQLG